MQFKGCGVFSFWQQSACYYVPRCTVFNTELCHKLSIRWIITAKESSAGEAGTALGERRSGEDLSKCHSANVWEKHTVTWKSAPLTPPSSTGLCNRSQHFYRQQEIHSANWHLRAQTVAVLEDPAATEGPRGREFAPCASPLELQVRWMEPCLQTQPMQFPPLEAPTSQPSPHSAADKILSVKTGFSSSTAVDWDWSNRLWDVPWKWMKKEQDVCIYIYI